jgi:hypothetical protein
MVVGDRMKECPLCAQQVPVGPEALNLHFERSCTWRHTSQNPQERRAAAPGKRRPDRS